MAETKHAPAVDSGIVEMWRKDGRLYAIAGFLVGLMIVPLISVINETGEIQAFLENLVPEAVGIFITVIFIERQIRRRDAENAIAALKRQLIDDAASISNEVAKNAVHQLFRKRWLRGRNGILGGEDLQDANLQGAYMQFANLQHSDLQFAKLQYSDLAMSDMRGAKLMYANLQGADLNGAKLEGADMEQANLKDANLFGATFDEDTTFPDGAKGKQGKDVNRFTEPTHPEFWQSPHWAEEI